MYPQPPFMSAPGWPSTPHIVCGHTREAVSLSPVPKTGKNFTDQQADLTADPTQMAQAMELTFVHSNYLQMGQSVDIPFTEPYASTASATTQLNISLASTQPTRKVCGPATVKNHADILRYRSATAAWRQKSQGLYRCRRAKMGCTKSYSCSSDRGRHEFYHCRRRTEVEKAMARPSVTCPLPECGDDCGRPDRLRKHAMARHGLDLVEDGHWQFPCRIEGCIGRMVLMDGINFSDTVSVGICMECYPERAM